MRTATTERHLCVRGLDARCAIHILPRPFGASPVSPKCCRSFERNVFSELQVLALLGLLSDCTGSRELVANLPKTCIASTRNSP